MVGICRSQRWRIDNLTRNLPDTEFRERGQQNPQQHESCTEHFDGLLNRIGVTTDEDNNGIKIQDKISTDNRFIRSERGEKKEGDLCI
jgi:hypothetical protein